MRKIFYGLIVVALLIITVTLTFVFHNQTKKGKSDIEKYNLENPVLMQYENFDDLKKALDGDDTYFVYFGKPNCPYCQRYLPIINDTLYNKNIPLLYYNAESIKGTYTDEEGNLCLNAEYKKVIDWIIENSIVDARQNSWIGSKTENNTTLDWLMVPRFFKVENKKITNCFKSFKEAEDAYTIYQKSKNDADKITFNRVVTNAFETFMTTQAQEKQN